MPRLRRVHRTSHALLMLLGMALASGCDRGAHPGQLGQVAPEFALNDGEHTVDLHALRGQVVVLNFWASWCAPCIQELPSLELLQQQLPQVKVVAVAFDEDPSAYHAFLQRRPLPIFTILDEHNTAGARYGTFRPPESYIIDKNGMIRRKLIGEQDWTSPEIIDSLREMAG